MLRSIKQLYGDKLGALDGEIGHVKDFYFDDQNWAVRYVVADTGSWLTGRLVLISPYCLRPPCPGRKSPARELDPETDRGQPFDWVAQAGVATIRRGVSPVLRLALLLAGRCVVGYERCSDDGYCRPNTREPCQRAAANERADAHLRSTQAVNGYHLQATDGMLGHVCDFMMDDQSWAIGQLVIKTGHRLFGQRGADTDQQG